MLYIDLAHKTEREVFIQCNLVFQHVTGNVFHEQVFQFAYDYWDYTDESTFDMFKRSHVLQNLYAIVNLRFEEAGGIKSVRYLYSS